MSNSRIELSWLNVPSITDDTSLILENPSITGSIGAPLINRIIYKIMYLRNMGPGPIYPTADPVAYSSGFYIGPYGTGDGSDSGLHLAKQWAALNDGTRAYGVFTVFGYTAGGASYIDQFIANTIDPTDLLMFQHNWIQGAGPSNAIAFNVARRQIDGALTLHADFEAFDSGMPALPSLETNGILKVCFGVRIPSTISPVRILVQHRVVYDEIVG